MTKAGTLQVIFDLGGVLIDWNPRYLYRPLFADDEPGMERFLAEVCSPAWNLGLDAGRPYAEAVAELVRLHPHERSGSRPITALARDGGRPDRTPPSPCWSSWTRPASPCGP